MSFLLQLSAGQLKFNLSRLAPPRITLGSGIVYRYIWSSNALLCTVSQALLPDIYPSQKPQDDTITEFENPTWSTSSALENSAVTPHLPTTCPRPRLPRRSSLRPRNVDRASPAPVSAVPGKGCPSCRWGSALAAASARLLRRRVSRRRMRSRNLRRLAQAARVSMAIWRSKAEETYLIAHCEPPVINRRPPEVRNEGNVEEVDQV